MQNPFLLLIKYKMFARRFYCGEKSWIKVLEEYKGKRNLDAHSLELDFLQCWFDIFKRREEHQSWNIWILSDQIAKPCWMATCNFKSDLLSWQIQSLFLGPLLYISFSIALLTTVMMIIIQPSPHMTQTYRHPHKGYLHHHLENCKHVYII